MELQLPINRIQQELKLKKRRSEEFLSGINKSLDEMSVRFGKNSHQYRSLHSKMQVIESDIKKLKEEILREHYRESDLVWDVVRLNMDDDRLQMVYDEVQRRLNGEEPNIIHI